jgi:PAS domain-containing protein
MSTFVLEFRAGYRSGKFSVANNARTIEEFETPSNIEGVKRSFSRELGCRADEVELTILADECELNPHAEGLDAMRTAEQSGHYRDFRIRWRKREYGVWGEWQSSTIASTARRVSDYTERQIQRLRRMYAEEMGVADLENVEVIVDSVVEPDARDQFITLPQL